MQRFQLTPNCQGIYANTTTAKKARATSCCLTKNRLRKKEAAALLFFALSKHPWSPGIRSRDHTLQRTLTSMAREQPELQRVWESKHIRNSWRHWDIKPGEKLQGGMAVTFSYLKFIPVSRYIPCSFCDLVRPHTFMEYHTGMKLGWQSPPTTPLANGQPYHVTQAFHS